MNTSLSLFEPLRDWVMFAYWQSFCILCLAIIFERFLRRSPWQSHLMLTLAIFASVLAPTVSLLIQHSGGGVISSGSMFAFEKQLEGIGAACVWIVLIGGLLFLSTFLYSVVSARRLMFQARPFPDRESQEALLEGSRMMQNVSLPVLFTSPAVKSPTVWSWGLHPAVLLPETLSETLSPEERDAVFLHELAHITRRDHWASLLNRLCGAVLFWNPFYWIALKLADLAANRACDLLVLSREKVSSEVYGETLLRLAAREKNRPVLQYLSRKELLMKRIDTILDFEENRDRYSVARTALKTIPLAIGILMLTTVLAFCQEKVGPEKYPFTAPENRLTHLVTFEPEKGFEPKIFDELYAILNPAMKESGVKWMFTKMERDKDGKQIFLCLTDDPEKVKAVIDTLPQLKFDKSERLTKESYESHTALWKGRVKKTADGKKVFQTPRLIEIEKSVWFQNLDDFQKAYARWDENQFVADYDLTLPEDENERKTLEKKWIELLEGEEPVRTKYDGTDEYTKAIVGLAMLKSLKAKELLANIAGERVVKDNAYRHTATKMLGELGDPAAIPDLIPLVYHFNFNTRADAQISLVRLTGQNFGNDAAAWGKWYNENRNELGKDLSEFDPKPIDWSCGEADAELRFYCDPKNQKNMDEAWLRRQDDEVKSKNFGQNTEQNIRSLVPLLGLDAVKSYRVDKKIADFSNEIDLSTPEKAYATQKHLIVSNRDDKIEQLEKMQFHPMKLSRRERVQLKQKIDRDWAKRYIDEFVVFEVISVGEDRAFVFGLREFDNLYDGNYFQRKEDGLWYNHGNEQDFEAEKMAKYVRNIYQTQNAAEYKSIKDFLKQKPEKSWRVDKKIADFSAEIDLSSPEKAYAMQKHLLASDRSDKIEQLENMQFYPGKMPERERMPLERKHDPDFAKRYLNEFVVFEVYRFDDDVAFVFGKREFDNLYDGNFFQKKSDGLWYNLGNFQDFDAEDMARDVESALERIEATDLTEIGTEPEKVRSYRVDRKVADFPENQIDLSTPEAAYALSNRIIAGDEPDRMTNLQQYTVGRSIPDNVKKWVESMSEADRKKVGDAVILKVFVYKDKSAMVVAEIDKDKRYNTRMFVNEYGRWFNIGGGGFFGGKSDEDVVKMCENLFQREVKRWDAEKPEKVWKTPDQVGHTHLVVFEPTEPFEPKTAQELLDALNEHLFKRNDILTGYFRTSKSEDGKLVGRICTTNPTRLREMIESTPYLKLEKIWLLDKKMFEEHTGQTVVEPGSVPKIVKMEPGNGAKDVDAEKTTELRVTFDIDMNTGGFSWCGGGDDFPGAESGMPRWTDKRTCVLPVKLVPGKTYRLSINAPSFKNFQSADGVPVEPVPYTFTTTDGEEKTKIEMPLFPPMKEAKYSQLLPDGLLKTLKEKRLAVKNADYTVRWFTERQNEKGVDVECERALFRFDGSNRWFADLSEIMQSDVFQTGCDGMTEWSLIVSKEETNYQKRKLEDIKEIHLSFLDPLRLLNADDHELKTAQENRKLRYFFYFGINKINNRECHLFGATSVRENKFGKTTTQTEIAIDAETGLPGPIRTLMEAERDFNGRKQNIVSLSTLMFDIEKINAEFSDADFLPKNIENLQAVENEKPEEGYDSFFVVIDDGSSGRMCVRCNGQKGAKGTSSSGLN